MVQVELVERRVHLIGRLEHAMLQQTILLDLVGDISEMMLNAQEGVGHGEGEDRRDEHSLDDILDHCQRSEVVTREPTRTVQRISIK